jgi:hypothetical protein
MTTNADYRRDLEDIRDRLDWVTQLAEVDDFSGIEERLDTIEERLDTIEGRLDKFIDAYSKMADAYKQLAEAYKGFPAMAGAIIREVVARPQASPSSKAFCGATAPRRSTKANRAKPRKPKLAVVSKDDPNDSDHEGPTAA